MTEMIQYLPSIYLFLCVVSVFIIVCYWRQQRKPPVHVPTWQIIQKKNDDGTIYYKVKENLPDIDDYGRIRANKLWGRKEFANPIQAETAIQYELAARDFRKFSFVTKEWD